MIYFIRFIYIDLQMYFILYTELTKSNHFFLQITDVNVKVKSVLFYLITSI